MTKSLANFFALLLLCLPFYSHSADEDKEWYTSKGGEYLVRDSLHGNLHALLSTSKSGTQSVYIVMRDSDCVDQSSDIISHDPIYINGTLTRYNQYCDGERRYFMPATRAGRENLLNEFKLKNVVKVKTYDGDTTFSFSAKGFTAKLKALNVSKKGI
ncbi:hypothetical protein VTH8203_04599 [Vibrio thalassae]|uniref:Uncharacterized protein n=1 Tax=Vibrio thalassae TaxID=1243014 RepID=A0A240EQM8_9VIBR|nr:hypothetical protein [Vibrio thalassae]SNX50924.1 hypothetical protein VTH8203_04599 [Vibrio thalassae]